MDDLLGLRIAATFVIDGSLSVLCGLMLSFFWLKRGGPKSNEEGGLSGSIAVSVKVSACLIFLTACLQFFLMTIDFCGQTSMRFVIGSLPDVASTHAGKTSLSLCAASFVLCIICWMRTTKIRGWVGGLLLAACLVIHAAVGHAAVDGMFSLGVVLQLVHLIAVALWTGGVLVSGLLIVPRMSGEHSVETNSAVRPYLSRLSAVSTYAVGVVLLSGIVKSYRTTEGSLVAVRSSHWGHILLVKSAVVALTILLGARNRWLLSSRSGWSQITFRRAILTLRAESFCMVVVLLLSAWLANSAPPME